MRLDSTVVDVLISRFLRIIAPIYLFSLKSFHSMKKSRLTKWETVSSISSQLFYHETTLERHRINSHLICNMVNSLWKSGYSYV